MFSRRLHILMNNKIIHTKTEVIKWGNERNEVLTLIEIYISFWISEITYFVHFSFLGQ